MIQRSDVEDLTTSSDTESIDVDGHPATLSADEDVLTITVALSDRNLELTSRGVARLDLLRIAEAAVTGDSIEPFLPDGLIQIADGPLDMPDRPAARTVSIIYSNDSGGRVAIRQGRGKASEVGLLGMLLPAYTPTETTVRGQHAVVMTPGGDGSEGYPVFEQWLEPPGLLVTVSATGLTQSELLDLIEGLRRSTPGEIDDLFARYGEPLPSGDDTLREGAVVIAEGDRGRNHWRVTATDAASGLLDVYFEDDHGGFGFAPGGAGGSGVPRLAVHTRDQFDALGETAVIGFAHPTIAKVVAMAPGEIDRPLDLHRDESLDRAVIVGFVPERYLGGNVVGLDETGNEIARVLLELPSEGEGDGTVPPGEDVGGTEVVSTDVDD